MRIRAPDRAGGCRALRIVKNRNLVRARLCADLRCVRGILCDERTSYQLKNAEFAFHERDYGGQAKYVRARFYAREYGRGGAFCRRVFLVWEIFTRNRVSCDLYSGAFACERGDYRVAEQARSAYF